MHALDWIAKHGTKIRSISAGKLRRVLNRQKRQCTWCGTHVPKNRRLWCSSACVAEYFARQPSTCSRVAYIRDRGICQLCGIDANRILSLLMRLHSGPPGVLSGYLHHLQQLGFFSKHPRVACNGFALLQSLQLMQADHIIPVCEGGGLCTVDNYRTVCVPCHKRITRELNQKRARQKCRKPRNSKPRKP